MAQDEIFDFLYKLIFRARNVQPLIFIIESSFKHYYYLVESASHPSWLTLQPGALGFVVKKKE